MTKQKVTIKNPKKNIRIVAPKRKNKPRYREKR